MSTAVKFDCPRANDPEVSKGLTGKMKRSKEEAMIRKSKFSSETVLQ